VSKSASQQVSESAGQRVCGPTICVAALVVYGLVGLLARGQAIAGIRPGRLIAQPAAVEYLYPEQVTVAAGKSSEVTLHFRIAQGLHINSHTPREEFLIPTAFSIPDGSGVRLEGANYPEGTDFTLPLDPDTKLSVYTDDFTIQARIVATAGNHLVEAKLRYQACDKNACMPPKTITVPIDVIGK
jgi:hypothetical protein